MGARGDSQPWDWSALWEQSGGQESATLAPLSGLTPLGRGTEETRSAEQAGPAWYPVGEPRQAVFQRSERLPGSGLSRGRQRTGELGRESGADHSGPCEAYGGQTDLILHDC